jgi:predicted GIY-YIG superfamily endonuclease
MFDNKQSAPGERVNAQPRACHTDSVRTRCNVSTLPLAAMEVGDETPTALYRFFSADDALLYVGITGELKARFAQHSTSKPWWPEVARKMISWYPTRDDAAMAETAAIRDEQPVHNVAGAVDSKPPRTGFPFAPPDAVVDPGAVVDRIRALLEADIGHSEFVLRAAAELDCGGRLPRGSELDDLAARCGVSRSMAYRILHKQDTSDRLHGETSEVSW